jgi:T5orf172 domain
MLEGGNCGYATNNNSQGGVMKGWVYVISNAAMPGLVKVGYSTKDPEISAQDLNHTGSPHPYIVEYEMLVEDPYEVEQQAHRLLSAKNEGKEWFRCPAEEAVVAIKQAAGTKIVTETYKRSERARGGWMFVLPMEWRLT